MIWAERLEVLLLPTTMPCWKYGPRPRQKSKCRLPEWIVSWRRMCQATGLERRIIWWLAFAVIFFFYLLKSDNYAVGSRNKGDSWVRIIVDVMVLWLSESGLNFLLPWKWKKIRGNWRDMRGVSELWWLEKIEKADAGMTGQIRNILKYLISFIRIWF